VLLAPSNTDRLINIKDFFQAVQILRLNRVQTESHWDRHEYTLALVNLLLYFVEEDVSVCANHHGEVGERFTLFVQLFQHAADGLGAIPVARLFSVLHTNLGDALNAERTQLVVDDVVHEEREDFVVFTN